MINKQAYVTPVVEFVTIIENSVLCQSQPQEYPGISLGEDPDM